MFSKLELESRPRKNETQEQLFDDWKQTQQHEKVELWNSLLHREEME
jgi:hypothetical protein